MVIGNWMDATTWNMSELPQFSWCVLNDTFNTPLCVNKPPSWIALAALYFTFTCTGLTIPAETPHTKWWQVSNNVEG